MDRSLPGRRTRVSGLVCAFAAGVVLLRASPPQQPAPPRFRETVTVERLLVDVRVVDASGRPVLGLGPEDFRVKVDGKSVEVESALWVGASEDPGLVVTPEGASAATAPPGFEPRLVVFLFHKDFEHSRMVGLVRMVAKLERLLAALAPEDRAAALVFDTELRLVRDFTSDHGRLKRAVEQDLFRSRVAVQQSDEPSLLAHFDLADAERAASPERALRLIAEALQPLAGAKTLVFFGWGLGSFSRMGVHMTPDYEPARRALPKARCSVFSLDVTEADFHSLELGLLQVAEDTGGFYAKTHLFPDQALARVEHALQGYYVLAFERPEGKPGARRLDVGLHGKKGTVLAPSAVG